MPDFDTSQNALQVQGFCKDKYEQVNLQIAFKEPIALDALLGLVSNVFKVDQDQLSDLKSDVNTLIKYAVIELGEGYKYVLELFFDRNKLPSNTINSDLELAGLFSVWFDQCVLISSESENPYEWLLVNGKDVKAVFQKNTNDKSLTID